jgi:hypothetical protein
VKLLAKQAFRSIQFQVLSLSKCLLELALPEFVICLRRQKQMHQQLSLLMKLMQSVDNAELDLVADMTNASKH